MENVNHVQIKTIVMFVRQQQINVLFVKKVSILMEQDVHYVV